MSKPAAIRMQRWTIGDAVRLGSEFGAHFGRLAADTPGTVVKLEFGRRVCVRFEKGDAWVDQDRLLGAQRTMEEFL
jgi:hypothetical protein